MGLNNHDKALEMYAAIQSKRAKEKRAKEKDLDIYFKKRLRKMSIIKIQ